MVGVAGKDYIAAPVALSIGISNLLTKTCKHTAQV